MLPNSYLCWNGVTHAQLLKIRVLVEFLIFWFSLFQFFKVFASSCELNPTMAILPILSILIRWPDGDSPSCTRETCCKYLYTSLTIKFLLCSLVDLYHIYYMSIFLSRILFKPSRSPEKIIPISVPY